MQSFNKLEKELVPLYRNRLNHAESVEDVKKFFSYTMKIFFNRIMGGSYEIQAEDLQLLPQQVPHYQFSNDITSNSKFKQLWLDSDLSKIVNRFAESGYHRYQHLEENKLKTRRKIKGH